jgi:ribosome biogenesis protein Nip4
MTIIETAERLKTFLHKQINSLALTNPLVGFSKPLILRVVDNKIHKVNDFLSMVADENGDIDVQSLVPEMIQSVMETNPFTLHTEFLGDLEVGGGFIKMNIPMTNNQIVLGKTDLDVLKELFL